MVRSYAFETELGTFWWSGVTEVREKSWNLKTCKNNFMLKEIQIMRERKRNIRERKRAILLNHRQYRSRRRILSHCGQPETFVPPFSLSLSTQSKA